VSTFSTGASSNEALTNTRNWLFGKESGTEHGGVEKALLAMENLIKTFPFPLKTRAIHLQKVFKTGVSLPEMLQYCLDSKVGSGGCSSPQIDGAQKAAEEATGLTADGKEGTEAEKEKTSHDKNHNNLEESKDIIMKERDADPNDTKPSAVPELARAADAGMDNEDEESEQTENMENEDEENECVGVYFHEKPLNLTAGKGSTFDIRAHKQAQRLLNIELGLMEIGRTD